MDARTWGRWWRLVGHAGLNNVLRTEWDPIGLPEDGPRDEYNAVTGPLASLLKAEAPTDQIANTLVEYRIRSLGSNQIRTPIEVRPTLSSLGIAPLWRTLARVIANSERRR